MKMDYEKKIFGVAPGPFEARRLLKLLEKQKGRVLDIGCGKGVLSKYIKKNRPDLEVYSCDISKKAIKIAKKNPQGVHFVVGDCHSLPFEDSLFDAVYMKHVLEHLEDVNAAIQEVRRVLKKNGFFYSVTPLEGSPSTFEYWIRKIEVVRQARDRYTGHVHAFSLKDLKEVIERNKFLVEDYSFSDFFLCQLVDSFYHPLLAILGRDFSFSFRDRYIAGRKAGFKRRLAVIIKTFLEAIFEVENILWQKFKIPGFIVYIKAVKS